MLDIIDKHIDEALEVGHMSKKKLKKLHSLIDNLRIIIEGELKANDNSKTD